MRGAALAVVCVGLGCSSGNPEARLAEQICTRLADRLESRLRAHQADLGLLRTWARSDGPARSTHDLSATVNDAVATHRAVVVLGPFCADVKNVEACSPTRSLTFLDDVDGAFRHTRTLLDGVRGKGPCAPDLAVRRASCFNMELHLNVGDQKLEMVHEGWANPTDERGLETRYAGYAAVQMAWWRALVDYGIALAPVCAPRAATSCEHLRDGLAGATPEDLADRVRALRRAIQEGTACSR